MMGHHHVSAVVDRVPGEQLQSFARAVRELEAGVELDDHGVRALAAQA